MISARIKQPLANAIFAAVLVVASVSQGDAFEARIDQFVVIKGTTTGTIVLINDKFADGNPPPSGAPPSVPPLSYLTKGVFAESAEPPRQRHHE